MSETPIYSLGAERLFDVVKNIETPSLFIA